MDWRQAVTAATMALGMAVTKVPDLPLDQSTKDWVIFGLIIVLAFGRSVLGAPKEVVYRESERLPRYQREDV